LAPLLDKTNKQYHADADKAIGRLHEEFERFRNGVPAFADDVTSWGTRFGLVGRMTKDKWKNFWKSEADPNSEDVKKYILDRFESHIMSRDRFQNSIDSTLSQFRDDVKASRNLLLAEMRMALTTRDLKVNFPTPDFDAFQRDFDDYVAKSVHGQGAAALENAVVALLASTAGTYAGEQLVVQIIRLLATDVAVTAGVGAATAGGSSAAGGGALGGAAGWLGGPAGAAIGVGVGLAIGALIDWWLTDRFKANLTTELTAYLDNLERDMIEGVAATETDQRKPGLRETFCKAADKMHSIQSEAVLKALEEAK
jgi:hypothetical protein